MSDLSRSVADHDSNALLARALRRRQRYVRTAHRSATLSATITNGLRQVVSRPHVLAGRHLLHLLVGLLVPFTILASQLPIAVPPIPPLPAPSLESRSGDVVAPAAPLALDATTDGEIPVPDSAFAAIDALPSAGWRPDLLRYQPIVAAVAADSANVRGGPGAEYDKLGELPSGTALQVLAQANGWYQVRLDNGQVV